MSDQQLPVDTLREAAPLLRRPFTPAAVKFKVQATWPKDNPTSGLVVAYIDARLVVERLNLVCPHLWFDEYQPMQTGLLCRLTVDGITRHDVGEGVGKGLFSDALKRAAVKFGVGVSLYAIPQTIVGTADGSAKQKRVRDGLSLVITDQGEKRVRAAYTQWLEQHGIEAFGEPLNHGDVDGAQGDVEADPVTPTTPAAPEAPAPTVDRADDAKATQAQVRKIFAAANEYGLEEHQVRAIVATYAGEPSTKQLARNDVDRVLKDIASAKQATA